MYANKARAIQHAESSILNVSDALKRQVAQNAKMIM